MDERSLAARYPFSSWGASLVREEGLQLEDLARDPQLEGARRKARERLLSLTSGGPPPPPSGDPLTEVGAYLICRVVLASLGDKILLRRFAEQESKRFASAAKLEDQEVLSALASELGVEVSWDGREALVPVHHYLRLSKRLSGDSWRLVNRDVRSGVVVLSKRELVRILQEAVREHLLSPTPRPPSLPDPLSRLAEEVMRTAPRRGPRGVGDRREVAPCMRVLLERLSRGENLNHFERFSLAAYLLKVGWSVDRVLEAFRNSPDFNEKVARYQIEHIARRGYLPPNCDTLRERGVCVRECGVRSPLAYRGRGSSGQD